MTDEQGTTTEPITEPTTEPKNEQPRSDKKWKILAGILAVLLILCGTWIIWGGVPFFPAAAPNDGGSSSQGGGLVIDPNAGEYVKPERAPGVTIPGFGSMTIPANTKELKGINLYNPIENEGWYYLTFKICLLDKNEEVSEVLYASQLVPPGQYLQDITISRGLPAGTYDAVMQIQPYRIADKSSTNNADLRMTIIAK
ncbi:MAG: hypothetical protein E7Z72_04200 [Methanocorpusculum parvum]|nr:hypothetical protein [Methanocorpusculum parvum]